MLFLAAADAISYLVQLTEQGTTSPGFTRLSADNVGVCHCGLFSVLHGPVAAVHGCRRPCHKQVACQLTALTVASRLAESIVVCHALALQPSFTFEEGADDVLQNGLCGKTWRAGGHRCNAAGCSSW